MSRPHLTKKTTCVKFCGNGVGAKELILKHIFLSYDEYQGILLICFEINKFMVSMVKSEKREINMRTKIGCF